MNNYQNKNFGKLADLDQYQFAPAALPAPIIGKLFLSEHLDLTSVDISINKDAPGTGMSFYHAHKQNEEIYIFLSGSGEMQIDDDKFEISEGSVISIEPSAMRAWWNTGETDLVYIVIQGKADSLVQAGLNDAAFGEAQVPWN